MKKLSAILIAFIILFTGCAGTGAELDKVSDLKALSVYGQTTFSQNSSEGYYEAGNPKQLESGNNILYTDFGTNQKIYLCSGANCMHNDDTCNSYIPGYCAEIFVVSDKLIYRTNETTAEDVDVQRLYSCSLDGTNKKVIYEISANEMYNQEMVSDENYIYFIVSRQKSKDEYADILMKLDFRNGEHVELLNLTKEFNKKKVKLYGTTDEDILFQVSDITNIGDNANVFETIVAYNTDGKKDKDFKEIKWNFEEQKYIFDKNNMYIIDYKNKTFSKTDLNTNETITVPGTINHDFTFMDLGKIQIIDGRLCVGIVVITNENNRRRRNEYTYFIDFDTQQIKQISLTYNYDGLTKDVTPVACANGKLMVMNGLKAEEHTFDGEKMGVHTEMVTVSQYTMISVDDYFNSNADYLPIAYRLN